MSISHSSQISKSANQQSKNRRARAAVPRPQLQNRRKVEVEQLLKGYPGCASGSDETEFKIGLKPSDPDFPFDIETLNLLLTVPLNYPSGRPFIKVLNEEIQVGFAANIVVGFNDISIKGESKTLVNLLLDLDKRLEEFLKRKKMSTVKIVKFPQKPSDPHASASDVVAAAMKQKVSSSAPQPQQKAQQRRGLLNKNQQKSERDGQITALTHRLGLKYSSVDHNTSNTFRIRLQVMDESALIPSELKTSDVHLHVPVTYPNVACSISFSNFSHENNTTTLLKRNIVNNFNVFAKGATSSWTLLSLVNYLNTQLSELVLPDFKFHEIQQILSEQAEEKKQCQEKKAALTAINEGDTVINAGIDEAKAEKNGDLVSEEKEVAEVTTSNVSQSEENIEENDTSIPSIVATGTAINLQGTQQTNISFFESTQINLVVQCERCKTQNDMLNLESGPYGKQSKPVAIVCLKCNNTLAGSFRKNIVVPNSGATYSNCLGWLDLNNCVPFTLISCTLIPTCEICSATLPEPIKNGRAACRECHAKMTLKWEDVSYDLVTPSSVDLTKANLSSLKKKKKENLGIVGGTPLPNEGCCKHYKKSHRWFRFACCSRVYPCDRCHDEMQEHPNEYANRMICGMCSREQNISQECRYCGYAFTIKHSGFWEGGKGTRDKTKMSKKDPRKYKRRGGGATAKSTKK